MKYSCIILRQCRQLLGASTPGPTGVLPLDPAGGVLPSFRPPHCPPLKKILRAPTISTDYLPRQLVVVFNSQSPFFVAAPVNTARSNAIILIIYTIKTSCLLQLHTMRRRREAELRLSTYVYLFSLSLIEFHARNSGEGVWGFMKA